MDRRQFLYASRRYLAGGVVTGTLLSTVGLVKGFAQSCSLTTVDYYKLGPYHLNDIPDKTNLLVREDPNSPLRIEGVLFGGDCHSPLINARIEVWQADFKGCYDHPNSCATTTDFHLYGAVKTNEFGKFSFDTVMPGAYPLNDSSFRTPHIHFLITTANDRRFISQWYFKGADYLDEDLGSNDPKAADRILDYQLNEDNVLVAKAVVNIEDLAPTNNLTEAFEVRRAHALSVLRLQDEIVFEASYLGSNQLNNNGGVLTVHNSQGRQVFKTRVNQQLTHWNITQTNTVKSGSYFATLEYFDLDFKKNRISKKFEIR